MGPMVCHQSCSNDSNIALVSSWPKSITNLSLLAWFLIAGVGPTAHIVPVFKKGAAGDISNYTDQSPSPVYLAK